MNSATGNYILEATLGMILLTWVVLRASAFTTVVNAGADAFIGGVKVLWH